MQFLRLTAVLQIAVIATATSLLLGCSATLTVHVPRRVTPTDDPVDTEELLVGAAQMDLTPIPGIPLGGYSAEAKASRGFWTRIWGRAIYVEDGRGLAMVLVSTDLMIMPAGLGDRVVELLHKETAGLDDPEIAKPLEHLGRESLLITATETHQGPSNFFSSPIYNGFSAAQEGFDEELFEFLARRITIAIKKAHHAKQLAKLQSSHFLGDKAEKHYIDNFVRNRSFRAFLFNPEAAEVLAENESRLSPCPVTAPDWPRDEYPFERACQAVHARVDLLHFRAKSDDSTIALAVFAPTHITILDATTEVYSGDVFNLAATMIGTKISSASTCGTSTGNPVVAMFNGAQGDVSLQWRNRNRGEALKFAQTLTSHVCGRIDAGLRDVPGPVKVSYQHEVAPLVARKFQDAEGYARTTEKEPKMGAAQFGGAQDQRTLFHDLGQKEGRTHYVRQEHGPKHTPLNIEFMGLKFDPISDIAKAVYGPPTTAPIGVYQLGDVALVGVPAEPTTVMARRIRKTVAKALSTDDTPEDWHRVIAVSFANGHISYVTTPEEYERQTYEGASDYWGAGTGPFLESRFKALADQLKGGQSTELDGVPHTYKIGTPRIFEPRNTWGPPWNPDAGLSNIVHGPSPPADPKRDFPTVCWRDSVPSLGTGSPRCDRVAPKVSVMLEGAGTPTSSSVLEIDSRPQTNLGFDLVTVMVGVSHDRTEWCSIWLRPEAGVPSGTCHFEVEPIKEVPEFTTREKSSSFACDSGLPKPIRPKQKDGPILTPLPPNDGTSIACRLHLPWCSQTCKAGDL